nr:T9SS type A sorting domain-containing protein [candidate division Zixibacteria bacterium]
MPNMIILNRSRAVPQVILLLILIFLFGSTAVFSSEKTCCTVKKVIDPDQMEPRQIPDLPQSVLEFMKVDRAKHNLEAKTPEDEAGSQSRYCPYWCDYCDDVYQLYWGSQYYYDYFYPWFEEYSCFTWEFYPDTGWVTVTIDNIGDWAESWAFVGICPADASDPENAWYASDYSCDDYCNYYSSVTISYYVSQAEELMVYVEYADYGGDNPEITLEHDPLDLDFRVTSYTWPSFVELYAPRTDPPTISFYVQNTGPDDVPPGFEVEARLYASGPVTCDDYYYDDEQDFECVEFQWGNEVLVNLEIYYPEMTSDDVFHILGVVDPDNYYEESYLEQMNNCEHLADLYWNIIMEGCVEYFDWDEWDGPPYTQWGFDEAVGIPVRAYAGFNTIDETTTDSWGYFQLEIPQNETFFYIEAYLDKPNEYIVYDGPSSYTIGAISEYYYEPDPYEVCLNAFDDYPDAYDDSVFNSGMNAVSTMNKTRNFMNNNGCSFTNNLITFRVIHELGDDVGSYSRTTRTLSLPSGYEEDMYYNRVIQHEFGHMVHFDAVAPWYFTTYPYHDVDWCTDTITAFAEGWAEFFSAIVPDYKECAVMVNHNYSVIDPLYVNIEDNDWENTGGICDGNEVEGVIASILYDMYDYSPIEMDPEKDNLDISFREIYQRLGSDLIMATGKFASAFDYLGSDFCALLRNGNYPADVLNSIGCPATSVFEEEETPLIPREFAISECYPNPFNSSTKLLFDIPHSGNLDITIYNVLGRKVYGEALEQISAGSYHYILDFDNLDNNALASGIYFLNARFDNKTATKKLNFLK